MNKIQFKKQKDFPLLELYKQNFYITDDVIFAYDNTIYSNTELPEHLIIHEKTHLKQQDELGLNIWVDNYLKDNNFRLKQELEAYQNQLNSIPQGKFRVLVKEKILTDLSGTLYGHIITKKEANKKLK